MKDKLLLIVSLAGIVGGISAIVFVLTQNNEPPTESFTEEVVETPTEVPTTPVVQGGVTVKYYGGPTDIKTATDGGVEYALVRNPVSTGGLTLAATEPSGSYYFALSPNGERIRFSDGDSKGLHGYDEVGLVSGLLVRDRFTTTEYFIAYPDSTSARNANFTDVPDTGVANRYLSTQFAKITNKNTGRSVVAQIDHRSNQAGVLLVSQAVGRELQLDNGATGNLSIELVPANQTTLGPVR